MEGLPNNGGYVAWIGKLQEGRSSTQEVLLEAGEYFGESSLSENCECGH
jgi:hypothetical protein